MTCRPLLSSLPSSTIAYRRVCWGGGLIHYQRLAADCLQRALRSRFRQQLKAGVDMTSDVKGCQPIFLGLHDVFPLVHRKRRSQQYATVDPADIRGLGTTLLVSVGCLPHSRLEYPVQASERRRGLHHTGAASLPMHLGTFPSCMFLSHAYHQEPSWAYAMSGTSLAMAHMKPVSSRAMATVTTLACLPRATRRR
jgi:hypothetical protein